MIALLTGCASLAVDDPTPRGGGQVFRDLDGRRNLTNINHVYLGMTYEEVMSIMGDKVNIGYRQDESTFRILEPITLKSPYRVEVLKARDKIYNVVYFYTGIKKSDGIVAEDELTPLVFQEGQLIGKGQDYLFQLRNQLKSS
jgi:hypothetical protein